MIGDAYFGLRAQLGTALFAVQSLAAELHAGAERISAMQELGRSLRDPFLLVVLSEQGSGTGALLDALFGRELWKAETHFSVEQVSVWKYADTARDLTNEPVAEHWRPAAFLRDFTVVVVSAGNPAVVATRFLPSADLVLAIFDATNPWAASGWDALKQLDSVVLERTVLILQHAGTLAAADRDAALAQLAERVGSSRPAFEVGELPALEAHTSLENFIDAQLVAGEPRRTKLREIARGIVDLADELRARVAEVTAVVEQDDARRQEVTQTLADRKEQSLRQIGGFLWALAQTCETAQRRGEDLLSAQLSAPAMLKLITRRAVWRSDFREEIEQRLQEAVERHIESSLHALDGDLRTVWQQFHEALQKGFPSGARVVATTPDFDKASAKLAAEIAGALREDAVPDPLEAQLGRMLVRVARGLRAAVALGVGALVWAAFASASKAAHAELALTLAAGAALLGIALGVLGRRRIVREFRRRTNDERESLINAIEDHLRPAVNRFYKELEGAFAPLRAFGAGQRKLCAAAVDRIAQIEATCRRCEAALCAPPVRP